MNSSMISNSQLKIMNGKNERTKGRSALEHNSNPVLLGLPEQTTDSRRSIAQLRDSLVFQSALFRSIGVDSREALAERVDESGTFVRSAGDFSGLELYSWARR